jgi:hypothetical protein
MMGELCIGFNSGVVHTEEERRQSEEGHVQAGLQLIVIDGDAALRADSSSRTLRIASRTLTRRRRRLAMTNGCRSRSRRGVGLFLLLLVFDCWCGLCGSVVGCVYVVVLFLLLLSLAVLFVCFFLLFLLPLLLLLCEIGMHLRCSEQMSEGHRGRTFTFGVWLLVRLSRDGKHVRERQNGERSSGERRGRRGGGQFDGR